MRSSRIFSLALIFMFSACSTLDEKSENAFVTVPSLKASLSFLDEEAKNWAEDAYLIDARLSLTATGYSQKLPYIDVEYVAPSKPGLSIGIWVMPDGSFEKNYFTHGRPLSVDVPIAESDWLLDSVDAFDIMFDPQSRADFDAYPDRFLSCSHMSLTRHYAVQDKVVWILLPSTCNMHSNYKFIDATSGDILSPNW
jgi:hypothetical protein